jgi:O-acetyl-ADP-ribose deacetylase (regulator of RNase III)
MPTSFVTGDLFAAKGIFAFAHGCNCAGAMGRGIAVEFKRRFPEMFREYKERCIDGRFQLGDVFMWKQSPTVVFNLGTQPHWKAPAELAAIATALRTMTAMAERDEIDRIALPRIGAGFGSLDWANIRPIVEATGEASQVQLVVFETFVAGQAPTNAGS